MPELRPSSSHLALQLGLDTLRLRPTLTILAVALLALGTALLSGLFGTVYLLHGIRQQVMSALTIEIELPPGDDSQRAQIMERAEAWPGVEFVQFVSPEAVLAEMEDEAGEDLLELFGSNPFPPLIRVRFGHTTLPVLDSLTAAARAWPGVIGVSYPRKLWDDLQRIAGRVQGRFALIAGVFVVFLMGIVGLCLRAQVRNRAAAWEFLILSGISPRTLGMSLLVQQLSVGVLAGMGAGLLLWLLTRAYGWLILRPVGLPFWYYVAAGLVALLLAVLAGLLSPRRIPS